jgi:hypothetical protein
MAIQEIVCALFKFGKVCNTLPTDRLLIEYILVPAVISILIIYSVTRLMLSGLDLKVHSLISITAYIVLVYSGLFGILAPMMYGFMYFFLIIGVVLFFATRIIKPSTMREIGRGSLKLGEMRADAKTIDRRINLKQTEAKELKARAQQMRDRGDITPREHAVIDILAQQVDNEVNILRTQIHKLDKLDPNAALNRKQDAERTVDDLLSKMVATMNKDGRYSPQEVDNLVSTMLRESKRPQ